VGAFTVKYEAEEWYREKGKKKFGFLNMYRLEDGNPDYGLQVILELHGDDDGKENN